MENISPAKLSTSDLAAHAANQNEKILQAQFEELENERDFLRLILNDSTNPDMLDKASVEMTAKKFKSYDEYCDLMDDIPSYELLNIEAELTHMCQSLQEELAGASIEVFFEKMPRLLGNNKRTKALLANLCKFTIFDIKAAKSIHVEFESSQCGNSLLWAVELHKSDSLRLDQEQISSSTFLLISEKLAIALGATLNAHFQRNSLLIELSLS